MLICRVSFRYRPAHAGRAAVTAGQESIAVAATACPSCSKSNPAGKRFCVECGLQLEPVCPACGAPVAAGEKFCGNCGARCTPAVPPLSATLARVAPADVPQPGGERRQLTVLFADLAGSTELTTRLDPEEYHEIVQAYHAAVGRVVARFEGYVAQYQGDGIVAYFGWPRAHGDDAERAVRAGLHLIDAIAALNRDLPARKHLAVRAGIDTGTVMVGHIGGGARREPTALGETPNIAARTQAAAPIGGLAITAATLHLVGGLFAVESLGVQHFKGLAHPLEIYRVLRAIGVRSRLHAARILTPFVGREQDLRTLTEWFDPVAAGAGQVVVVRGEPGIGKSRLIRQFRETLATRPHSWLEHFCSPFDLNTPFAPIVDLLAESFIWSGNETADERMAALEKGLRAAGLKLEETIPLVAEMLNLAVPAHYPPVVSPPEQKRRRLIAALVQWLFALARLQPLVMVLEDVHWADPSTLELHQALVEQCAALPVMLIYTARPEFIAPWPTRTHHAHLMLARLSGRHTREMAQLAVARAALTDRTLDLVVERTDGVPLFVEELARVVVEAGGGEDSGRRIPATLADSLMARIDNLGPAKQVAQLAAVIGREFSWALLREIADRPDADLQAGLDQIVEADLIGARGEAPRVTYLFKHVMVRDAAYGSLLKSRRRELHAAVAQALQTRFSRLIEIEPELLAYHLTEAGAAAEAFIAWRQAGDRSATRGALAEASNHYTRALEVLLATDESTTRDRHEMPLLIALGSIYSATQGLASLEVERVFRRARELSVRLDKNQASALLGLWQTYLARGELAAAATLAEQRLAIAEREGSAPSLCWSHYALGATHLHRGNLDAAVVHLRTAVERSRGRDSAARQFDAGPLATSYLAVALVLAGRADEARLTAVRALEAAEELAKPSNIAFCAINVAAMYQLSGDPAATLAVARKASELGHAHGIEQLASALDVYIGWAIAATGKPDEGVERVRRGIAGWMAKGQRLPHAWYLSLLAWAYAKAGRFDEAAGTIEDAAAAVGELLMEGPIVGCTHAEILRIADAPAAALEAILRATLAAARQTGNRLFALRATIGLARLAGSAGDRAAAHAMLAGVYGEFTEGFATPDLAEARRLLADLAA